MLKNIFQDKLLLDSTELNVDEWTPTTRPGDRPGAKDCKSLDDVSNPICIVTRNSISIFILHFKLEAVLKVAWSIEPEAPLKPGKNNIRRLLLRASRAFFSKATDNFFAAYKSGIHS